MFRKLLDNSRGELWVMIQGVILAAIVLAPVVDSLPALPTSLSGIGLVIGGAGVILALASVFNLGASLTAVPRPKDDATLIQTGLYSLVRHPIYFSIIVGALGWSLFRGSWLALLLTIGLGFFFDRKAAREELWLVERYPDYPAYRTRVKKLIPFVY